MYEPAAIGAFPSAREGYEPARLVLARHVDAPAETARLRRDEAGALDVLSGLPSGAVAELHPLRLATAMPEAQVDVLAALRALRPVLRVLHEGCDSRESLLATGALIVVGAGVAPAQVTIVRQKQWPGEKGATALLTRHELISGTASVLLAFASRASTAFKVGHGVRHATVHAAAAGARKIAWAVRALVLLERILVPEALATLAACISVAATATTAAVIAAAVGPLALLIAGEVAVRAACAAGERHS